MKTTYGPLPPAPGSPGSRIRTATPYLFRSPHRFNPTHQLTTRLDPHQDDAFRRSRELNEEVVDGAGFGDSRKPAERISGRLYRRSTGGVGSAGASGQGATGTDARSHRATQQPGTQQAAPYLSQP